MNFGKYDSNLIEREQQNVDSSAYLFKNYRDQCNNDTSIGHSNGHVPPCLIDADSDLRQSVQTKMLYQPETSELRTDCYAMNGRRGTICNKGMDELTNNYIPNATDETCPFNQHLNGGCTPKFWQVTTVANQPHLLQHTVEPFTRGGMNSRHYSRSNDLQNKQGNIREIKYSH